MSTPDDLSILRNKPFSEAISRFEELLNQSGRAFLIGAGCSKCAGLPLTTELTETVLDSTELDDTSKRILATVRNLFDGSANAHIEDYLSELVDHLAIAERRKERNAQFETVQVGDHRFTADNLRTTVDQVKRAICATIEANVSIDTHRAFVSAIHRPLRVGKDSADQVVDYLVLNYDNLLEDALALERVPYADGIDGGVTGWWNPQTFDRENLKARVFKLHGSINWCEFEDDPLPRRILGNLGVTDKKKRRMLIWPASTKYRETQMDPYAQLMDRARSVVRPNDGSQRVLVVCGYSFGDTHINRELDKALRQSAGDLTIVAFTSDQEPTGQLKSWREDSTVGNQVLIFADKGFFHGEREDKSEASLPWWKFENITRLLR